MKVDSGLSEIVPTRERRAHGPWSDLALHTIGWRAFQDLCSQVCEVVLGRPVETFREAQDGGQDAVFLIPSGSDAPAIGTVQCKHTSEAGKALKAGDLTGEIENVEELVEAGLADTYAFMTNMSVDAAAADIIDDPRDQVRRSVEAIKERKREAEDESDTDWTHIVTQKKEESALPPARATTRSIFDDIDR